MSKIKFNSSSMVPGKKRSFYVALGICLAAIAIASFVTYNNVKNYMLKESASKQSMEISQKFKNESNRVTRDKEFDERPSNYLKEFKESEYEKDKILKAQEENNTNIPVKAQKAGSIIYPSENKDVLKDDSGDNPVFSKTFNDWRVHNGVDFALEKGSKVKSISTGEVKNIFEDQILGFTVEVEHEGGFIAYYSGLDKNVLVKLSDKLESGQDIGTIDKIPGESEDGYHLHLSIKKADKFIDPMEVLGKGE